MKDEVIKIQVQCYNDRCDIVRALVNSGYKVWQIEEKPNFGISSKYYVCFERKQKHVRDDV